MRDIVAVIRSRTGGRDEQRHSAQARARHAGVGFPLVGMNF